jgi:hypothetical protein
LGAPLVALIVEVDAPLSLQSHRRERLPHRQEVSRVDEGGNHEVIGSSRQTGAGGGDRCWYVRADGGAHVGGHGIGCTVYEAGTRVGGRVFSNDSYWADGQTSEWGGEAIDQEHTMMRQLAQRFGLNTRDVTKAAPAHADQVFHFDGGSYPRSQADEDSKAVNHFVGKATFAAWHLNPLDRRASLDFR